MDKTFVSDYIKIIPSRLWKTNLTKFAVIGVKRRQKAGFWGPISSKITLTKEKERRKRKSEEEKRRAREKKAMVAFLVFKMTTLEIVVGR